ncbi:MAG TPA: hypothetical protein GXZ91_05145 [Christensenellaceae bacterium]|nr:hypothetical protein [Christensenellaceae bacterium]
MDLIFFRHGAAQPHRINTPDEQRRLVDSGRVKTRRAAKKLRKRPLRKPITILSSPAMRALQTGLIIKETLADSAFDVVDAIYTGNTKELKEAISALPHGGTCIIVGHEPLLSNWVGDLIGVSCHIRKSGYVMLRKLDDAGYNAVGLHRSEATY